MENSSCHLQSFELSFQNSLQDYCFHLEGFRVFNCPLEHIFKAKNEHNLYRDELWGPFGSTGSGTGEGLLEDQTTRPWRHRHPHPAATTSGLQREGASPALCVRLVPWLTSQASGGQDTDDMAFVLLAHACTHTHTHTFSAQPPPPASVKNAVVARPYAPSVPMSPHKVAASPVSPAVPK